MREFPYTAHAMNFVFLYLQRSSQWLNEGSLFVSGIHVCPLNAKVCVSQPAQCWTLITIYMEVCTLIIISTYQNMYMCVLQLVHGNHNTWKCTSVVGISYQMCMQLPGGISEY